MSIFVYGIIMLLFLTFAIVLSQGKGAFLIAGFNTMPEEEKKQYDEQALARFMGKMMYGYCFCVLLWILNELFHTQWLFFSIGLVLFVALTIFLMIYVNTGNRFKK
ncbi:MULTISPECIES: DUF3784 domain-containing protein [Lysinibacillus]|jgi:hypothetical protein|uniref:DUF3784 domain-containing protein n=1 Tax=Lysinibacillus fusiformis TaxID=28031 RepID=A0A2I0V0E6_9BACI|nr:MULTISPECIES: DUF3784 domain-containing protein [Lysinibacillus]KUF31984.1 hypothetical protein AK833_14445 [Lysinibacillus sp. F5]MEE3806188.1 DUF3784 domain-containing protein [Lysinibacillus fusiformis]PKU51787.1 DUF3784 domain-containing protein [Lysinibacillus fusiformis]WCH46068.1 DUF3784 domain-containing protein [Lysinibacillus sp. OF-1]SCZ07385.1 protein of unknown function [Lysinibacillus sp. SG9]